MLSRLSYLLCQSCLLFTALVFENVCYSEVIEARMPNGLIATAEYRSSGSDLPTILIIHGFLATRNFQTVARLTNALFDEGYSVLSPTLTLNVDKRKVSLPCEAIHTHTMEEDTKEISYWVNWLNAKGKNRIIMVGHSYGSVIILSYALKNRHPSVIKLIATSLVVDEHTLGKKTIENQVKTALKKLKNGNKDLDEYKISYCQRFVAPPNAYLSYASWSQPRLLDSLSKVKIPIHVILGGNDNRIKKQWPKTLRKKGVSLTLVNGANHFFDAEHEFDLLENVIESIK